MFSVFLSDSISVFNPVRYNEGIWQVVTKLVTLPSALISSIYKMITKILEFLLSKGLVNSDILNNFIQTRTSLTKSGKYLQGMARNKHIVKPVP